MTIANWQDVGTGHETDPAWPTHIANDWGFLAVQWHGGALDTPADWTEIPGSPFPAAGGTEFVSVFQCLATSGAMGAPNLSGPTNHAWGVIFTVRNAHLTNPIHALANQQCNTTTSVIAPGLKVAIDDLLVVDVCAWNVDSAGPIASGEANASLTGYTERYDAGTITGGGGGLTIYSGTIAGPTTLVDSTATVSNTGLAGIKIAIAPIADNTINATAELDDGTAVADGETVYLWDVTQPAASYLVATTTTGGGTGAFSFDVPYTDHAYVATIYWVEGSEPGTPFSGASAVGFYNSFFGHDIVVDTGSGGGGDAYPDFGRSLGGLGI